MSKIIIAILMFLFLILIHEFGHFIIAKLSGIKVNEFSVGMGPKLLSKQKGETQYSLRLIPIGGYCAMEGEDEESNDPRSYDNAKPSKRFLTILAGPLMNLILAVIIFFIIALNSGSPTNEIGRFAENSPAKEAGMQVGDRIVEVGLKEVNDFTDISKNLNDYYESHDSKEEIPIKVIRDNKPIDFNLIAEDKDGSKFLGVESKLKPRGVFAAIKSGFVETGRNIAMIFTVLGKLFTGEIAVSALSGPIGVVNEIGNQAANGLMSLLYFLSYISVNLAVFNLLPIPALDGSKLLTSLYEMVTKKKVNKKLEEKVTIGGFILLLGLILIISIKDIITLF
ncbi:MAG: RIP metalloprotease RseP [Anaerococcus sp.]|nr:RIP metalloprotease RseP [Anaerococcus sp.]